MAEGSSELKTKNIEARNQMNVGQAATVGADYVKVLCDNNLRLCTLVFFQRHPIPKQSEEGIAMEGTNDVPFLEVKLPYSSAFALSMYMDMIMKQLQKTQTFKGSTWGPTSIKQEKVE